MKINTKYLVLGSIGLVLTYVFQYQLNIYGWIQGDFESWQDNYEYWNDIPPLQFIINKTFRYLLNDGFSILLIHGLFNDKKFTQFAIWVMAFGLLVLMPAYFLLFLYPPQGYSSMISHLHRIVMNPVLMMLLIAAKIGKKYA